MNIKRAKQEIKDTIEAYLLKDEYGQYVIPQIRQRPILLLGAPGIGKTQIMEQISRECKIALVAYTITHHTRQSAIGLPMISRESFDGKEYSVTEYTMSEIIASVYEKIRKTGLKEGILFIDEINCASETLAPAMLQFLQCKTFGRHAVPEGWVIVAAGNPAEYNKSVREFDVVTMDRVKKIEVEPEFSVWKEYALENRLHPAVTSYLEARPGNFYRMETTVDGRKFATPRGWEDLSVMLTVYEQLGKEMSREVVVQYIQHEAIAKDFANYLELFARYQMDYQLDAVLEGHIDASMLAKASAAPFDERLSLVSLILSKLRNAFVALENQQEVIELLYGQLKQLKVDLMVLDCPPEQILQMTSDRLETVRNKEKESELLTRRREKNILQAQKQLSELRRMVIGDAEIDDADSLMESVQEWFSDVQDLAENREESAGAMLEHAFDFMEAAFAGGQEMVIFITEMNNDRHFVHFLQDYECDRYFRYNRDLLFDENQNAIERRLEALNL